MKAALLHASFLFEDLPEVENLDAPVLGLRPDLSCCSCNAMSSINSGLLNRILFRCKFKIIVHGDIMAKAYCWAGTYAGITVRRLVDLLIW